MSHGGLSSDTPFSPNRNEDAEKEAQEADPPAPVGEHIVVEPPPPIYPTAPDRAVRRRPQMENRDEVLGPSVREGDIHTTEATQGSPGPGTTGGMAIATQPEAVNTSPTPHLNVARGDEEGCSNVVGES